MPPPLPRHAVWFVHFAIVAAAYYAGGRLGLSVPFVGSHISLIWPPTGIALAALLRWELSLWPAVWLGAFAVNLSVGSSPLLAFAIACGNTLGPWLAARLLRRRGFAPALTRREDIVAFLLVGAGAGMALNAGNGVLQLWLAGILPGPRILEAGLIWWLGDAMGALLVGIPLLTAPGPGRHTEATDRRGLELAILAVLTLGVGAWVFRGSAGHSSPLLYLPFFLLSWLAIRGGAHVAASTALLLSSQAVWATAQGGGPFHTGDIHGSLAMLWGYMASASIITVLITVLVGELRTSERRLTLAMMGGQQALWDWDLRTDRVRFTGEERALAGIVPDVRESPSAAWLALAHPEDRPRLQQALADYLAGGRSFLDTEYRVQAGRQELWVQLRGRSVEQDAAGQPLRLAGTLLDISPRKHGELALARTNSRNEALLRAASDGIHVLAMDGRLQEASDAFCEMLGYAREELLHRHVWDWDAQWSRAELEQGLRSLEGRATFETRHRHRDGHLLDVEISAIGVDLDDGRYLYCSARDITQRKQALALLQRTQDTLERAQAVAHVGSWRFELGSGRIEWSDETYRIFGYEEGSPLSFELFVARLHDEDRERVLAAWQAALGGAPYDIEHRIVAYGRVRWVRERAEVIFDAEGRPLEGVGTVQDITEARLAEQAMRESRARMRALIDATTESVMLLDPEGRLLAINEFGAQRFGRHTEEMLGQNFFALLPPEVATRRRAVVAALSSSGEPMHFRDERNGICFDNSLYPVKDDNGRVESVAVYAKDVTESVRGARIEEIFRRLDAAMLQWRTSLEAIATMFCEELLPVFELPAAWIGKADAEGQVRLIGRAAAPGASPLLEIAPELLRGDASGSCPALRRVLREGALQRLSLAGSDCRACPPCDGRAGWLLLPLRMRGEVRGVLALYEGRERQLDGARHHLDAAAARLGAALEAATQQEWLTLLDTALAQVSNAVMVTDADGRIQWVNRAFSELSGYSLEEFRGQTPRILSSRAHRTGFYKALWRTIRAGHSWRGEITNRRRDGSRYVTQQTITPLLGEDGQISHFVAIAEDVTARKAMEERIHHAAHYDPLTDLPNRGLFFDRLRQALALSRRDRQMGALLFLDLDRFKDVNDRYGHAAGDRLLVAIAERLRRQVRESDTVARLAGDEFTVILPRLRHRDDAQLVAEKILAAVAQPILHEGQPLPAGTSIGIALFPEHGEDPEQLLHAADQAMYQAKQAGRNQIRVAQPAPAGTAEPVPAP